MNRLRKRRAILFDAGDTLLFPKPSREEMFQRIAGDLGLALSIERIGQGYRRLDLHLARHRRCLPRAGLDDVETFNFLILEGAGVHGDLLGCARAITRAFDGIESFDFQAPAETHGILSRLVQSGYRLGVVSNWDASLERILAVLGLAAFFDTVTVSQRVGFAKPDHRIFAFALRRMRVEPVDAFHIGDSYHTDVIGARSAGITPILFDWKVCFPNVDCLRIERLDALGEVLEAEAEVGY